MQHSFNHASDVDRFIRSLITETHGRYPFPTSNYVPPKPSILQLRCAHDLSEMLRLTASSGIDPLRLAIVDAAFSLSGIDKKRHLNFLIREILAPAVMQIFNETCEQGKSKVDSRSLTRIIRTLECHTADAEDKIVRKDVADILNKAFARHMFTIADTKNIQNPEGAGPQLRLVR